jgi:hypothetical protein
MAEERVERRLTAILAADIAGYSRLMSTDEEGTLAALKTLRGEVVDPKIKEHRGRIVNTTGDGLLSEFASVVDAVRCAAEVQREMAARNAGVPAERRIDFRIGINLGDVMIDASDIFGDGVNVAARLDLVRIDERIEERCHGHSRRHRVFSRSAGAYAGRPVTFGATRPNPAAARSSPSTKASMNRTGLSEPT